MNAKEITLAVAAVAVSLVGYECYRRMFSNKTAQQPTEPDVGQNMNVETVDVLNNAKEMLYDIVDDRSLSTEQRNEQLLGLRSLLIYTHITTKDCTQDENRLYVFWVRKMNDNNPEIIEAIIRKAADANINTLSGIRELVEETYKTKGRHQPKEKRVVKLTTQNLSKTTTVAAAREQGLDIPDGDYKEDIKCVLDIPIEVRFESSDCVVVVSELA